MSERSPEQQIVLTSVDGSVQLRQLMPADAQAQFDLLQGDPSYLAQFTEDPETSYGSPDAIRAQIEQSLASDDSYRFGIWDTGQETGTPTMVGAVELTLMGNNRAAIATWVGRAHAGHGYGSRASEPLAEFAFNDLGLTQLFRKIREDNTASRRMAENAGFTLDRISPAGIATYVLNRPGSEMYD